MTSLSKRAWLPLFAVAALAISLARLQAGGEAVPPRGPVSPAEIEQRISELSHSSYDRRTHATRQLCAIGMQARPALEAAAAGDNPEAAIRARVLLRTLDQLLFSGVDVTLAFDSERVDWDDPVTLLVQMHNPTPWPAKVPFPPDRRAGEGDFVGDQVGRMLDVADWLRVRGPDGSPVDLHTDDYAPDSAVARAVERRLADAPTSMLTPGERRTVELVQFNRGWSRYRLLEAGTYSAQLDYDPPWSDVYLREHHVGRVTSNRAEVEITASAPEGVSRAGIVAGLTLQRSDEDIVVTLRNRLDVPYAVNTSFGTNGRHARGTWVYRNESDLREMVHASRGVDAPSAHPSPAFVELQPGTSMEIARLSRQELAGMLERAGADIHNSGWSLSFRYWNPWHAVESQGVAPSARVASDDDAVPAVSAPRRRLTTDQVSNRLVDPLSDQ